MENQQSPGRPNPRPKRRLSRTRIIMALLLIVAIPIFVALANKAVHENSDLIRQGLGQ